MKHTIISIEGNIGSGKSTLVKRIKDELTTKTINGRKIICIQEPVSEWNNIKDKNGVTILEKFYENQDKYAFSFQMMAYISRLAILKKTIEDNPDAIIITERCTDTDRYVFAQMMHDSGKIEDVNFAIYLKWYETFITEIKIKGCVYVKTTPSICNARIKMRSRDGEDSIPLEYLENCHKYHERWLSTDENKLILNGDYDISSNEYNSFINKINNYICSLTSINKQGYSYKKNWTTNYEHLFDNHFC